MKNLNPFSAGFSLVELMIVVAIIGIVITVAAPRYRTYQSLNKRKEAINNLNQIHSLMQIKLQEDRSFNRGLGAFNANATYGRTTATTGNCNAPDWASRIGFKLNPCVSGRPGSLPTYRYIMNVTAANAFTALACDVVGIIGPCLYEAITIDQNQVLTINRDAITCTNGGNLPANLRCP